MRYLSGVNEIDLNKGIVIKSGVRYSVRAKTLQVLRLLIEHRETTVDKAVLLDTIWHDVVVQEQVLVQSIKEIRDLLGSDVIKTYPRKGYQWVAEITPVNVINSFVSFKHIMLVSASIFFICLGFWRYQSSESDELSVAFLPVENAMPDNLHQWVPLLGMDHLTKALANQSSLAVLDSDHILYGYERLSQSHVENVDEAIIYQLRQTLGADIIVQTRLTGFPQDFQLHYTLHFAHNIERGVELANSVTGVYDKLVARLATHYGQYQPNKAIDYKSDFSNEAFVIGIEHYLEQDYSSALPLLQAALNLEPDLLAARRYLAASYANANNVSKAMSLLEENILKAEIKGDNREVLRAYLMIGYLQINQTSSQDKHQSLLNAERYIEQARQLAHKAEDKLFIAYSYEELGKIKRLQGHFSESNRLLNHALEYHRTFRGTYGQTAALIELAKVAAAQNEHDEAQRYLEKAQTIADENGAPANQIWVLLAKAEVARWQQRESAAKALAKAAMDIADKSENPHLITRVNAWLEHKSVYTVN